MKSHGSNHDFATNSCIVQASLVAHWVKNLPANAGDAEDLCLIPELGRSPGGENGNPLQYSCQGNPMDKEAWWATIHGSQRVEYSLATKQRNSHKNKMLMTQTTLYKISKLQESIVQHRECSQYFIITINGVQSIKTLNHTHTWNAKLSHPSGGICISPLTLHPQPCNPLPGIRINMRGFFFFSFQYLKNWHGGGNIWYDLWFCRRLFFQVIKIQED